MAPTPVQPKKSVMRRFWSLVFGGAIGIFIVAAPSGPVRAEWLGTSVLRGALDGYTRWDGFYFGAQGTYTSGGADFGNATQPLVAYILRNTFIEQNFAVSNWTTLGKRDSNSTGFGAFVGYNSQWNDAVLGLEVSYTKTNWTVSSSDSLSRHMDSGGTRYAATVDASASVNLIDYTSIRGRAGYAIGQFMPYGLVGFVVGRADIVKSATVTESETDIATGTITGALGPTTQADNQSGKFIYGYSAGLGLEVALTPNIFARGEYEYVQFAGLGGMHLYLNTVRAGLGLRF
jgi:opacity protein-like surface antigen